MESTIKKFMPPSFADEMLQLTEQACFYAMNGNHEAIASLVCHPHNGMFINKRNLKGFNPLYYAAKGKSPGTLANLLNSPAVNINYPSADSKTPLHVVSNPEALAMFLVKGADINVKDCMGKTPKECAAPELQAVYDKFQRAGIQGLVEAYPILIQFNVVPKESLVSVLAEKLIGKNEGKLVLTWRLRQAELIQSQGWKKAKGYVYKEVVAGTPEHSDFLLYFNGKLDGKSIDIKEIRMIFNGSLVSGFCGTHSKLVLRHADSPQTFKHDTWKQAPDAKDKAWVLEQFEKRCNDIHWNSELNLPILPVLHGTDANIANSICQTGFSAVSSLDEGFFGQGMYFSSSAIYTLPYFATKAEPVILLCWLIPGNTFPVTEDPNSPDSLKGKPLKGGYQSHYVVTDQNGVVTGPLTANRYDEIVVNQEAQVVPAYVIYVDKQNLGGLREEWFKNTKAANERIAANASLEAQLAMMRVEPTALNPGGRPAFERQPRPSAVVVGPPRGGGPAPVPLHSPVNNNGAHGFEQTPPPQQQELWVGQQEPVWVDEPHAAPPQKEFPSYEVAPNPDDSIEAELAALDAAMSGRSTTPTPTPNTYNSRPSSGGNFPPTPAPVADPTPLPLVADITTNSDGRPAFQRPSRGGPGAMNGPTGGGPGPGGPGFRGGPNDNRMSFNPAMVGPAGGGPRGGFGNGPNRGGPRGGGPGGDNRMSFNPGAGIGGPPRGGPGNDNRMSFNPGAGIGGGPPRGGNGPVRGNPRGGLPRGGPQGTVVRHSYNPGMGGPPRGGGMFGPADGFQQQPNRHSYNPGTGTNKPFQQPDGGNAFFDPNMTASNGHNPAVTTTPQPAPSHTPNRGRGGPGLIARGRGGAIRGGPPRGGGQPQPASVPQYTQPVVETYQEYQEQPGELY